jgi:hypothetical protein
VKRRNHSRNLLKTRGSSDDREIRPPSSATAVQIAGRTEPRHSTGIEARKVASRACFAAKTEAQHLRSGQRPRRALFLKKLIWTGVVRYRPLVIAESRFQGSMVCRFAFGRLRLQHLPSRDVLGSTIGSRRAAFFVPRVGKILPGEELLGSACMTEVASVLQWHALSDSISPAQSGI